MIFFAVASFAFVSGTLVFLAGIEPRNLEKKPDSDADRDGQQDSPLTGVWKGILAILNSVQRVFRIRSFQVILLVGIIETFHWVSRMFPITLSQQFHFLYTVLLTLYPALSLHRGVFTKGRVMRAQLR